MECPACGAHLLFELRRLPEDADEESVSRRDAWRLVEDRALLREAQAGEEDR